LKKKHLYITVLVLSLAVYFVFEWTKPKPVDWTESYSGLDKIPYGCFIMRDILPDLFPQQPINYQNKPIFTSEDTTRSKNVLFINNRFSPDTFEVKKLLDQAKDGRNIFIAAREIDGKLADTLQIEISKPPVFTNSDLSAEEDSTVLSFTEKTGEQRNKWYYPAKLASHHFTSFDTLNTTVLGISGDNTSNYIKIKRGSGAFYIHTIPYLFTNYYMRDYQKAVYAFRALSYLPVAPTIWDEYYKAGRTVSSSPLRYIVSHRYLKWAWITTLIGLFLFIIFRAKRRERIIPEITKPKNTTVEFTQTIGRLYHQNGNHKDLATQKIKYFMEYIRAELNLETDQIDQKFIKHVAQRSGTDIETVESIFQRINKVQNQEKLSSSGLWKLNEQIETFYQQSSR
jgi:hypothetical protein